MNFFISDILNFLFDIVILSFQMFQLIIVLYILFSACIVHDIGQCNFK